MLCVPSGGGKRLGFWELQLLVGDALQCLGAKGSALIYFLFFSAFTISSYFPLGFLTSSLFPTPIFHHLSHFYTGFCLAAETYSLIFVVTVGLFSLFSGITWHSPSLDSGNNLISTLAFVIHWEQLKFMPIDKNSSLAYFICWVKLDFPFC